MYLVFDIGKTNKKCFLFDENYQEIWKGYAQFPEMEDEDGFPCDDLAAIVKWIKTTLNRLLQQYKHEIKKINFSTYGASFVHVDRKGKVLTPLYNYLKPYPLEVLTSFYQKYGSKKKIAQATASPASGMLNSGLQLYWLKETQAELYSNIRWSLHFPQYLSYLLTGIPVSDFTSVGCHTSLWDYQKQDYHDWVYAEGIHHKLPPIVGTNTSIRRKIAEQFLDIGVGIHDSSSALLPYLKSTRQPFLLFSTGTWSIALNPFNNSELSQKGLKKGELNYMQINGNPIRASRLFLGKEYSLQLKKLRKYYKMGKKAHRKIKFKETIYQQLMKNFQHHFAFDAINVKRSSPKTTDLSSFATFEMAYHQLMLELVELQVTYAERVIGKTAVKKIFIDGGFADNDLFVKLLTRHFQDLKIRTTQSPSGSALGAAMVLSEEPISSDFLKKQYAMKKY
ncbi:MAG: FGGY family carbohydrate kinase [Bacteroidota bacterium]